MVLVVFGNGNRYPYLVVLGTSFPSCLPERRSGSQAMRCSLLVQALAPQKSQTGQHVSQKAHGRNSKTYVHGSKSSMAPNYTLRHPVETIRPFMEVNWEVLASRQLGPRSERRYSIWARIPPYLGPNTSKFEYLDSMGKVASQRLL